MKRTTDRLNAKGSVLVGLLAFQGDYAAHGAVCDLLGIASREIRRGDELDGCSHLIIPGGESTAFLKLNEFRNLTDAMRAHGDWGKPILATCAGLILIAERVEGISQKSLGLLDATVKRNAYGRQVDSFETELSIPVLGEEPFHGIFIRAPIILSVGPKAEILASHDGNPILVRQNNIIGATFHPELADDTRFHKWFFSL